MSKERHVKSKKKETWTDLRAVIKRLCENLNISTDEFSELNIKEWKKIEPKIWTRFSSSKNSKWIWETLVDSYATAPVSYKTLKLENFINPTERVWFLLDDTVNEKTKFWIYEGTVKAFEKLFRESIWTDEVLIVSKKYEWILIINHHDIMIGTGKLKDRIEEYKKESTIV
ncbi:hypothetical protein AWW68_08090 [Roseivirga spongicola]|uniref:Uncharacterized protein n=1 Tax=Roseivirga spongicola TaxID=333140 RepID=A0A150XAN1_9BACT|nr:MULTISPECIES: DUF6756 family protein [Roseivirga]KYG75785.1 hypothetical protein AWW68_08090 [Roseivirga spongicola]MBO6495940.1 hypothetical protein [Roseivirga sp.]